MSGSGYHVAPKEEIMTQQPKSFKIEDQLIDIKKGNKVTKYLPVMWRLVWFRELYPNGIIETEMIHLDLDRKFEVEVVCWENNKRTTKMKQGSGYALFKATIKNGDGGASTGHKKENAANFGDFEEKAETGSIGRALAALGFGTQFTDEEFAEGERLADSPVEKPQPAQPKAQSNGKKPEPEPANAPAIDQQKASIEKLCERLGKPAPAVANFNQARELIRQLTEELKAQKQAEQSNGQQPRAQEDTKMITEQQLNALLNLYGKLEIDLPSDLDKWSAEQASVGIKELSAKARAAKASA